MHWINHVSVACKTYVASVAGSTGAIIVWVASVFGVTGAVVVLIGFLAEAGFEGIGEYLKIGLSIGGVIGGVLVALIGGKILRVGKELTSTEGSTVRSKIEEIVTETKGLNTELREIDHRLIRVEERLKLAQERKRSE